MQSLLDALLCGRYSSEYIDWGRLILQETEDFSLQGAYNLIGETVSLCLKSLHIKEK